jgi:signal transduction histidine kinase
MRKLNLKPNINIKRNNPALHRQIFYRWIILKSLTCLMAGCYILAGLLLLNTQAKGQNQDPDFLMKMTDTLVSRITKSNSPELQNDLRSFAEGILERGQDKDLLPDIIKRLDKEGSLNRNLGNYTLALYYHRLALSLAYRINDIALQATIYNNIGVVYRRMDDYEPAINNHLTALRLNELTNNKHGAAISINSIGNINYVMGRLDDALRYFTRSLALEQETGSKRGIAINLNNIGNVYKSKGDTASALKFYERSLLVNKGINDIKGVGICLNDIGLIQLAQRRYPQALRNFVEANRLFLQTSDRRFIAESYLNTGKTFNAMHNYAEALPNLQKALNIGRNINARSLAQEALTALSEIYANKGNYIKALEMAVSASDLRDSILNEINQKNIANLQAIYETQKAEQEKEHYQAQSELNQMRLKRQQLIFLFAGITVSIAALLLGFAYHNKRKSGILLQEKNIQLASTREELRKYAAELEVSRDRAQASDRAKSEFLANMSHEIRTPLNAIIGFTDLIDKQSKDKDILKYLQIIRSSGKSLMVLINDILDLSKIEAGKLEIKRQYVSLNRLITEIIEIFSLEAAQKGLELSYKLESGISGGILSDEARLRQVLFNLVGNAVKYTTSGKVSIQVTKCCPENSSQNKNSNVTDLIICVSDTGPGISSDDQRKIFDAFYRGHQIETNSGAGLGLPIAQRLTELMGGELKLDSQAGQGSIFTLHFPGIVTIKDSIDLPSEQVPEELKSLRASTVLIADDVESNRMLLSGFLGTSPVRILEAADGLTALKTTLEEKPDLVLMDIRMPGMTGFQSAQAIKNQPETSHIPIIAVTASVFGDDIDRLRSGPFDGILLKPVMLKEFTELVYKFIGQKPAI